MQSRGKKIWELITYAEDAYRKKAEADEALHRHVPVQAPLHTCISARKRFCMCRCFLSTSSPARLRAHAYCKHVHARAIEDLNSYVEPSHILFCTMQVPELTRKLDKIHGAGIPAAKGSQGRKHMNYP
jgi:hypothetical protein